MKLAKAHNQRINGFSRLVMTAPLLAVVVSCAINQGPPPFGKAIAASYTPHPKEAPLNYDQYLAQGKSALNGGDTSSAIGNFKQALLQAGSDESKQQEAYGNLGLAYAAASDDPKAQVYAQVYLEKAGAKGDAPAWIKDAYKNLISRQQFKTAEVMNMTAQAEEEIEKQQPQRRRRGFISVAVKHYSISRKPVPSKPYAQTKKDGKNLEQIPVSSSDVVYQLAGPALDNWINFTVDSAKLTPEGERQADELGKFLQSKLTGSGQNALLVGHCDMNGSDAHNDRLSKERAASVKTYLVSKFPDLTGKLVEEGMGKRQLLFKETDEEHQRLNRRVEAIIVVPHSGRIGQGQV